MFFGNLFKCVECNSKINNSVNDYSLETFNHPLCISCQGWFKNILENSSATDEAIELYFALKRRGVPAELEKSDGFKTIDIAIPEVKMNIEVDGRHHNYSSKQAFSDLKRTLHSFKKGYYTIRIPNCLTTADVEETADLITELLLIRRNEFNH